jgi:predicted glycosyl hydrolase (DUF1957 family)
MSLIDQLFEEYSKERKLELNKEQFIYLITLFPALLVVLSDGIVDREEWVTVKRLAKIMGDEFASEDLGEEKEENLMLIYKGEFRHLLKAREQWEKKILSALKEYFTENQQSKEFVMETMYLFAHASDGVSEEEDETIMHLTEKLGLEDTSL